MRGEGCQERHPDGEGDSMSAHVHNSHEHRVKYENIVYNKDLDWSFNMVRGAIAMLPRRYSVTPKDTKLKLKELKDYLEKTCKNT